jgi:hypothetical protein
MGGAELESVRVILLPDNKAEKKGFHRQWVMTMRDVPVGAIELWQRGLATCSVQDLSSARRNLKRQIKRQLGER